jgi:hypothetical protein
MLGTYPTHLILCDTITVILTGNHRDVFTFIVSLPVISYTSIFARFCKFRMFMYTAINE